MKVVVGLFIGVFLAFGIAISWFMFNPVTNDERALVCNLPEPQRFVNDDGEEFLTVYGYRDGGVFADTYRAWLGKFQLVESRAFGADGETAHRHIDLSRPESTEI